MERYIGLKNVDYKSLDMSFKEVIIKGLELYKENFGCFFSFAMCAFLFYEIARLCVFLYQASHKINSIPIFFYFNLLIVTIYFSGRCIIGLNRAIGYRYFGIQKGFKEIFVESKDVIQRYVAILLLIIASVAAPEGFIAMVSIFFVIIVTSSSSWTSIAIWFVISIIFIGLVSVIFFVIYKFTFVILVIIFKPNEMNFFRCGFDIIRGQHKLLIPVIVIVIVFYSALFGLMAVITEIFSNIPLILFVIKAFVGLIAAIFQPMLFSVLCIIFFNRVEDHMYTTISTCTSSNGSSLFVQK